MELNQNLEVIWKGKFPLKCIKWNKKTYEMFSLPQKYNSEIQENWFNHKNKNPNDYDGDLVFLNNIKFKGKYLLLNVSLIKFSTVIYMVKNNIPFKEGIGVLSTQYLVFSPNKQYILVGERSIHQSYYPGYTTCPGGIVELNDLNQPPEIALKRELNEEVGLTFQSDTFLNAILVGWNNVSVTFLISTLVSKSFNFNPKNHIATEQDEWEGNLKWFSIEDLKKTKTIRLLDGLIYYKSEIMNVKSS